MNEEKDIFDFIEKRKVDVPHKAYFENLSQSIISSQKTRVIPFYKRPITWIGAAAAVALVLMMVRLDSPQETVVQTDVLSELNNIPREVILAYVEENIDDFDIELIAEFVPASALEYEPIEQEITDEKETTNETISFDDITRDDILEYLEDEGIDLSDLEDEDSFI